MFDPYYKWLGIPPDEQPPDHYRLLGIRRFEPDAEVIDAAANRQMGYVQSFAGGPHGPLSQRLLNELAAARLCLLDPRRRAAYDAALRRAPATAEPRAPRHPDPIPPEERPVFALAVEDDAPRPTGARAGGLAASPIVVGLVAGLMGALALAVLLSRPSAETPAAAPPAAAPPAEARAPSATVVTAPVAAPTRLTNSIGMTLALVPAGEFRMGTDRVARVAERDETPPHRVRISRPFYIGIHEVTNQQYRAVLGPPPGHDRGPDYPVSHVAWGDARRFCRELSQAEGRRYRLPTEAEWEYACRAGSDAAWTCGDDAAALTRVAWIDRNSGGISHNVGSLDPNAFGLHDIHGNLAEWCADWYDPGFYGKSPAADPVNSDAGDRATTRVIRGGHYRSFLESCRSAYRSAQSPQARSDLVGFRVVCEVEANAVGAAPSADEAAVYAIDVNPPEADVVVLELGATLTGQGRRRRLIIERPRPDQTITVVASRQGYAPERVVLRPTPGLRSGFTIFLNR